MKFITRISLLLVCCCFLSNTQAQNRFGFKTGIGFATFSGVDTDSLEGDLGSILSIPIGLLYEISINDKLSVQPELLFRQKGFKVVGLFDDNGNTFKLKSKFVVNYLELPILFKYHLGDDPEEVRFFASAGPSFAFATSAYRIARITGLGQTDRQRQPAEWDQLAYNRFETSLDLGLGIKIPVDAGVLEFDARYLLGLTNVNKEEALNDVNYNRAYSFTMGYKISFSEIKD